jgi:hypothetical protein
VTDEEYIRAQMDRVRPITDTGNFLVKFGGDHSETKWLSLTADQYDMVRELLSTPVPDHPRQGVVYLPSGQAAERFGVTPRTLGKWMETGVVQPTYRTLRGHARFSTQDIERQIVEARRYGRGGSVAW